MPPCQSGRQQEQTCGGRKRGKGRGDAKPVSSHPPTHERQAVATMGRWGNF